MPPAWISLTLSCHFFLSFIASGWSSGLHPISSQSCCMYVRAGHPAFAWPCVGVHRSTSLMSLSLLLQQCPACLVHLTRIAFMMGGRWPYSCALWGVASRNYSILLAAFLCNCRLAFFSSRFVSIQVVHPYSSIDTTAAWKKLRFILSVRSDFHMINSLSIAVRAFVSRVLMRHCFLGRWTCQPVSESFRLVWKCRLFDVAHVFSFVCIVMEANASSGLFQTMQ